MLVALAAARRRLPNRGSDRTATAAAAVTAVAEVASARGAPPTPGRAEPVVSAWEAAAAPALTHTAVGAEQDSADMAARARTTVGGVGGALGGGAGGKGGGGGGGG